MTSRYEGLPYVLLEAQSVGLPVVAFDVGGLSTAVDHGATGFVVAQDDEAGFHAALRRLVSDAGLRRDMGDAAPAAGGTLPARGHGRPDRSALCSVSAPSAPPARREGKRDGAPDGALGAACRAVGLPPSAISEVGSPG